MTESKPESDITFNGRDPSQELCFVIYSVDTRPDQTRVSLSLAMGCRVGEDPGNEVEYNYMYVVIWKDCSAKLQMFDNM